MLDHTIGEQVNVAFAPDCVGDLARELDDKLEDGKVLLLENLRFYAEEEANDPVFAKKLAGLCQIYVNDAFGSRIARTLRRKALRTSCSMPWPAFSWRRS